MRYFVYGLIGSIPGSILAMWNLRLGLGWAFAGAVLIGTLAINGVSISRVLRLFVAMMLSRNLGIPHEWLAPSQDELSPIERVREQTVNDWFRGKDIGDRRGRFVLVAIIVGILVSLGVVCHDLWLTAADDEKVFVFREPKVTIEDKIWLLFVTVPGAMGGIVALLGCPAYRRPVLMSNVVPAIAMIAMLIAGFDKASGMLLFFVVASWFGMGLGLLFGYED